MATSTTSSACRCGKRRPLRRAGPGPRSSRITRCPARFDRYIFTAGYNTIINRRQFGFTDLNWPTEYRYPDRTYHDALDVSVGGVDFALRHEKGETDDHTVTWQADARVLCCGDLFIWASPNAGNPQKVQRYPREWADALRRMLALDAEFLLPGHGFPVLGADRVRQALTDTADLLDSLVDQTLAVMNAGGRLDDAIHTVRAARGSGGPALSPPGLRRAGVRRAHRLAPVRRVVGRQPGHPQAGARAGARRRAGRAGRRCRRPGRPCARAPGGRERRARIRGGACRRGPPPRRAPGRARLAGRPRRRRRPAGAPADLRGAGSPGDFDHGAGVFTWASNESTASAAAPAAQPHPHAH